MSGASAGLAAVAVDGLDLTALEPAAQSVCAESVARLLCSLEAPLQLLVRRRRVARFAEPAKPPQGELAHRLDDAQRRHRAEVLGALPAFRSDLFLAMRGGASLQRQLGLAVDMLHSAGLRTRALPPEEPAVSEAGIAAERAHSVETAQGWRCGLALERLPGRPVGIGWLQPMLAASAEFDAALHLVPVDAPAAHRAVDRRLRDLTADRLLDLDRGRIGNASLDVGLEAATSLRERLARNEVHALRLSLTVAVHGANEAEARHGAEIVRAAAAGAGLRLRHTRFDHAHAARSTTLGAAPPGRGKLVDTSAAATCLPLTETVCDDAIGYRVGFARRTGLPVSVDVFDSAQHSNANVAVFATSGHGKSFTLGALVLEAAARGAGALIVDPEGEYGRLMNALGGEYLRLGSPTAGALNVFDAAPSATEAIPVAVDLVNVLCGSVLTEVERARVDAALHEAVTAAAAAGRTPLLGDCVPALERSAPRAGAVLRRVCAGPLAKLFNRQSDIDLSGRVAAISLRDLPQEFVPAATLLIAHWLWLRVRHERARRHIVLDEVGALCVHPPLRELLVQLARRCRKHGASLVVATQNVEDLLRTEEGSVVATNCATLLLGGHRAAEAARMERAFGLTEAQRRFLEHAGRGEFLLLAGRRRCEIRVDLPGLHRSILTP